MTKSQAIKPQADILIVDDTPTNLRLLGQILDKHYKVRLAPSGPIALRAAQSTPPDLILLDIMMPEMDGYEVANRLKTDDRTREIPVIFISALDDIDSKVRAFDAGGVDYVTKPFQEKEILVRVATHLSLRRLYRQAQAEITERKRVEEKLRESEERFRLMVQSTNDIVFTLDCDQRHTGVYGPWVEKSGLTPDFFLGKTARDIFGSNADVHEEANQRALRGESVLYDWSVHEKDGDLYYQTSLSPLRNSTGEVIGLVGIGRDVTERARMEKALRESELHYRALVEGIPGIVYSYSSKSGGVYYSPHVAEVLGCPLEKMYAEPMFWHDSIHPDDLPRVDQVIQDSKAGKPFHIEYRIKDAQGIWHWFDDRSISFKRQQNDIVIGGLALDITEQKQVEEALIDSEAFSKRIFDSSRVPIVVMDSETLQFIDCNPATLRIYEFSSHKEVLGKTPMDVSAPVQYDGTPSAEKARFYIEKAITEGAAVFEWRHQRPSGEIWDGEVHLVSFQSGERHLLQFTLQDITQRKQAEKALKESQELFSLFMYYSPVYAFIKTVTPTESRVIVASENYRDMVGIPGSLMNGRTMEELFPPEYAAKFTADDWAVVSSGNVLKQDEDLNGRNYTTIKFPIKQAGRTLLAGYTIDITERKQAEENVRRMAERWSIVYRAGEEISASLNMEQVFAAIHRAVKQLMPCEDFVISLYDEDRNTMQGNYILEHDQRLAPSPYVADHGLGGYIVHSGKSVLLNTPEQIKTSGIVFEPYGKDDITDSVLAVPLQVKGKNIGILSAQSYHSDAYTTSDQELLEMLASHAAVAIDNARLYEQAQQEIAERKRVEDALRSSNARLEVLFQVSPLAITMFDTQGKVVLWNDAAEKIFGWSAQEIIGQPNPIVPVDKQMEYETWVNQILHGKPIINQETTRLRKDGSLIEVSLSSASVYDSTGDVLGRMAIIADITERKSAETELHRVNTLMNMVIENIPNMIFLKDAKDLRFVRFNRAGEELLGYSRADLLGKNDYDFFPKEQADFFTGKDRAVLASPDIIDIAEEPLQTRNKGLRTLHTKKVALHDAKGEAEYLLGISEDITERKRAEEALLHRNQEMATLYETSLEINSLSDVSSLLKAIIRRACELLNIPSGALYMVEPDSETLELVVAHQLPPNWVGIRIRKGEGLAGRVVQTQKPMVVEDYMTWDSRLEVFHDSPARRVLAVPLKLHDQVNGVIIMVDREVGAFSEDEIRLASLFADQAAIAVSNAQFAAQLEDRVAQRTAELEVANRELEGLSYNIAHDMRSPVRAMVGYSGMLRQAHQAQLDSDGAQLVENIYVSGLRLGQMIDGFLNFLHLGHIIIHLRPLNMDGLVRQLVETIELKERQVEFRIEKLPECQGDFKLLEKVWEQLISNALKFTRPREVAQIEIGSGETDGKCYYFVRDNGVGFDMRYVDKLFGVFQKLHHETDFEGIGIGLAITRRIVQAHGGRIWAEAELNKGATFYFTLGD